MDEDINAYRPLCDIKDCGAPQCGKPFEGFLKTRFNTIQLPVRIMPCSLHLKQLENLAVRNG